VRNAFFVLLFMNLAYFAWAHWIDVPQAPPANPAFAKLQRLKLADELPPSQRPTANSANNTAQNGSTCLSVGPFPDIDNSAKAAALLREKGFDPKQRAEEAQMSAGYWVYVNGVASQVEVDRALVALEHIGIKDAVVMPEIPDAGRRLSLGLYSERARAEKRAQAVRQAGLKAEVAERKLAAATYWVDLAPLPGMNTVPIHDLFAEGVSSRIAVQPCPAATQSAVPPTGTATASPASAPRATAPSTPPVQAAAGRQLP
jgi:hypothetical protein